MKMTALLGMNYSKQIFCMQYSMLSGLKICIKERVPPESFLLSFQVICVP